MDGDASLFGSESEDADSELHESESGNESDDEITLVTLNAQLKTIDHKVSNLVRLFHTLVDKRNAANRDADIDPEAPDAVPDELADNAPVPTICYSMYMGSIREIFIQWVWEDIILPEYKLSGIIEIDDSLFGRRIKYHKGNPGSAERIWIVGLVARIRGRVILYPVENRSTKTLMLIIKEHVKVGSTIYTDGWVGYARLNSSGYRHFSVLHSEGYKKKYRNVQTGEIVSVDTNFVEGSWSGAKAHFKRIHGESIANFNRISYFRDDVEKLP